MEQNDKVIAVTRYNNEELFHMMQSLVPIPVQKIEGFDDWIGAVKYLEHILSIPDVDFIVNIDLDCFITDWSQVESIIEEMDELGFTHAGISDAEMKGRENDSWVVMNPFFNVFNMKQIRKLVYFGNWGRIYKQGYNIDWSEIEGNYKQPFTEPFNGIFNWLYTYGYALFLDSETNNDGISVDVKVYQKPFAHHSWYSREFNHDDFHRQRIINLYEDAKNRNLGLKGSQ
jgi:hypothetical protein